MWCVSAFVGSACFGYLLLAAMLVTGAQHLAPPGPPPTEPPVSTYSPGAAHPDPAAGTDGSLPPLAGG